MKIDPAKHDWMVAPETRKLLAVSRRAIWPNVKSSGRGFVVPAISHDKIIESEHRHAD